MLTIPVLKKLWPRAPDAVIADVVGHAPAVFKRFDISTPLRVAHFMAQISHESGGGTVREENLNYRSAARISQVWPSRFSPETAQAYVGKPRELANKVYNGRMGNRTGTDDGFNFRGRGLLQLTGRENYTKVGKRLGLDLETNPGLAAVPDKALLIAADEFVHSGCLPFCDKDDIRTVTKRVNGGYIGIDDRRAWLAKWKLALPDLPGQLPDEAEIEDMEKPLPRQADGDPASKTATKSKTLWSVIGTIISAIGAPIAAALSDWRVVAAICVITVFFALFIGRERLLKLWEDHV